MQLALRFISGKYQGGEFPIEEGREIVVGRSSDLDMVLVEEMVSRKHARIALTDGRILIKDLGSTNGTFVNGERIHESEIKEGDRVLIGSNILKVVGLEAEEAAQPKRGAPVKLPRPRRAEGSESRMSGDIEEIPLPDLLQLFATSKKTAVLIVDTEGASGRIYLNEGRIYYVTLHSAANPALELAPLKAAYRMLTWVTGSFELAPPDSKTFDQPIDASVQEVLMEGFRQKDEFDQMASKLPPREAVVQLKSPLEPALRDLESIQLDVLQFAINAGSIGGTLDSSPLSDLETANALIKLLEDGYLSH